MSLILDALRRADADRETINPLSMDEQILSDTGQTKKQKNIFFLLFVITLIVLICVLVASYFSLFSNQDQGLVDDATDSTKIAQQKSVSSQTGNSENDSLKNSVEISKSVRNSAPTQSEARRFTLAEAKQQSIRPEPLRAQAEKNKASSKQSIEQLYKSENTVDSQAPTNRKTSPTTNTSSKVPANTQVVSSNSIADVEDATPIRALRKAVKEKIPTLLYSEHIYANSAGSYVVINSSSKRVGEALAPGIKLVQILSDGIIAEIGQERFKIRALSSWVNY